MRRVCGNALEIALRGGVEMGAADHDDQFARSASACANRLRRRNLPAGKFQALGAVADNPAPDEPERRRNDNAELRYSLRHEPDIDSIFVAAGDEFARAVERIDQEIVGAGSGPRVFRLFLRHRRQARRKSRQAVTDDRFRNLVRRRYRRAVGFDANAAIRAAVENSLCRRDADGGQPVHEFGASCGIEARHGTPRMFRSFAIRPKCPCIQSVHISKCPCNHDAVTPGNHDAVTPARLQNRPRCDTQRP